MDIQTDTIYNEKELDDLRQQTIKWFASAGQVHFQKMLSVTLTFEPTTLKMSSVSRGSANLVISSCDRENMSMHFTER